MEILKYNFKSHNFTSNILKFSTLIMENYPKFLNTIILCFVIINWNFGFCVAGKIIIV
jgi:hypothetical protein